MLLWPGLRVRRPPGRGGGGPAASHRDGHDVSEPARALGGLPLPAGLPVSRARLPATVTSVARSTHHRGWPGADSAPPGRKLAPDLDSESDPAAATRGGATGGSPRLSQESPSRPGGSE